MRRLRSNPAALALAGLALWIAPAAADALQILADYALATDLSDSTGSFDDIQLSGAPAPLSPSAGSPLNLNGGQNAQTPSISNLDITDFQFDIEFRTESFSSSRPVIMGGRSFRWLGLYLDSSGFVGIRSGSIGSQYSATQLDLDTWYAAQVRYEGGQVQLFIDGELVLDEAIGALVTNGRTNDFKFTTTDFSTNRAFHGDIRNLTIANDTSLVVPEPAPLVLTGGGLLLLGLCERRRRQRVSA